SRNEAGVKVRLAYDELNLAEFPFALLSDRQRPGVSTLIFTDDIRSPDGQSVKRVWTVTGAEEFGLPTPADEAVYLVLSELTRAQGLSSAKVHFSRYELVRRLGWPDKGSSYSRLHQALDRLLGVTITATRAFYDIKTHAYVDVGFHIIDDYALVKEPPGRKGREAEPPQSYIRWNTVIYASFLAGYVKGLDLSTYLMLRSAVSRRLYRYLDKKRYDGKPEFRIGLYKLAFEKLGMSRTYYPSHIRAELARAHEELLRIGFIRSVDYVSSQVTGEPIVVYRFGRGKSPAPHADLVDKLVRLGMAEPVALELVMTDPEAVRRQLEFLPYREARNPAGLLVRAVREDWPPPPAYPALAPADSPTPKPPPQVNSPVRGLDEILDMLPLQERQEIERRAKDELQRQNPRVASRPASAAYQALIRDRMSKIIAAERPDLLSRSPN
ncbi:MAG: replication initiator protein A, partial [Armatimonadetes bacterium]|nr:replication initiator protein A [Armatimonadota bacterium]